MKNLYAQCLLRRAGSYTVSFIPYGFAKVGNIVQVKFPDGWEDGWRVESAGDPVPKSQADLYANQHRRQRQGSDI